MRWNGADLATTFGSPTQLSATVPASNITAAGNVPITVFNPAPGGGASNALTFSILIPPPTITSLNPAWAPAGGSSFTLTVTGTIFSSTSVVRWNGVSRTTTYVSGTQLRASILAGDIAAPGTATITVFTSGVGSSNGIAFDVQRMPSSLYFSNNPTVWVDKNESIARIDLNTKQTTYFPASYDYYKNADGWANPDGMTFVGNRLFITGYIPGTGNPRGIWEVNPQTLGEISYFVTTLGRPRGLASDGRDLYVAQYYGSLYTIYKYTTSGQLLSQFNVSADMYGLAYGRGYLYGASGNKIYKIDPVSRKVVSSFVVPWSNVQGLDFVDGLHPYLLASVNMAGKIYVIDLNSNGDLTGTTFEFATIPVGYNNSVVAAPF